MSKHKIVTEIYHPPSFAVPGGGPEVEITFEYRPATRDVWSGRMACPAQPESIEFLEARYTHDNSLLEGHWEEWARVELDRGMWDLPREYKSAGVSSPALALCAAALRARAASS